MLLPSSCRMSAAYAHARDWSGPANIAQYSIVSTQMVSGWTQCHVADLPLSERPRRSQIWDNDDPRSGTTQRMRDADCCTVGCLQPAVETPADLAGPQHTRQVQRQAVEFLLRVASPAPRALCQRTDACCRARHAARSRQHRCVALNPIRCSEKTTRSTRVQGVSVRNTPRCCTAALLCLALTAHGSGLVGSVFLGKTSAGKLGRE